ncbi:hypothetical protein Hanom_Chr15g01365121 [Helianthus anomalus]
MTLVLAIKFKTRLLWRPSVRNGAESGFTIVDLQAGKFFRELVAQICIHSKSDCYGMDAFAD